MLGKLTSSFGKLLKLKMIDKLKKLTTNLKTKKRERRLYIFIKESEDIFLPNCSVTANNRFEWNHTHLIGTLHAVSVEYSAVKLILCLGFSQNHSTNRSHSRCSFSQNNHCLKHMFWSSEFSSWTWFLCRSYNCKQRDLKLFTSPQLKFLKWRKSATFTVKF